MVVTSQSSIIEDVKASARRGSFARDPLLGVVDLAVALQVAHYELAPDDTLVLYTDGLTEARNAGVLFWTEGSKATLTRQIKASPEERAPAPVIGAVLDVRYGRCRAVAPCPV